MKSSAALSSLNRIGSLRILTVSAATLLASYAGARGQAISVSGIGSYTQNFDTLPTSAGTNWTDNITIPGWYARTDVLVSPTLPIGLYSGGSTTVVSGFLSVGFATSSERSLGTRPTTASYGTILIGALFRNTSALPLAVGNIEYNAELWFTQATASNFDGYQFFYQIGTSPITSLNPFTVNNTATFAANASVDDVGWNRVATLDYSDSNASAGLALARPS